MRASAKMPAQGGGSPVGPINVSVRTIMNTIAKPKLHIEIVGFTERERTLFSAFFKATNTFQPWQPDEQRNPDCILLDIENEAGRMCCERELRYPSGPPVITVGGNITRKFPVVAQLPRPLRWTDLMQTLDRALQPYCDTLYEKTAEESSKPGYSTESFDAAADIYKTRKKKFKTKPAVLVVNPNPIGWRFITKQLTDAGYQVDHVSTGAKAISLMMEHRYNCIIAETELPDTDGFALCKLAKQSNDRRRIAAIILTTNPKPLDRIRGALAGCNAFISKPIDPEKLITIVQKFLPDCRPQEMPVTA
ncbi:MAG: two-component system, cell cycle response regulator [Burkholderiales bacterium]|jgi:CheY-like chemotaxis protein|nr:response regulator [Burkholderia sp.]